MNSFSRFALVLLSALMAMPGVAWGQSKPRTPVKFECQCSDQVGSLYATAFRDLLAQSPRYQEVSAAVEKDTTGKITALTFHILVVSIDPSGQNEGKAAAIAVTLLIGDDYYESQQVQWCPSSDVKRCAEGTMSFMDGLISGDRAR